MKVEWNGGNACENVGVLRLPELDDGDVIIVIYSNGKMVQRVIAGAHGSLITTGAHTAAVEFCTEKRDADQA